MEKTYKILETLLEGANEKLQSSHSCLQQASMALMKLQGKESLKQTTGKLDMCRVLGTKGEIRALESQLGQALDEIWIVWIPYI
jgi:hypothetical protein